MLKITIIYTSLILSLNSIADAQITLLHQNSSPKYFSPKSNKKGLCDIIYEKIEQRLAPKRIAFKKNMAMLPIKRILSMLENGEGHVFCGAGRTKDRDKNFIYSTYPIYEVNNVVVGHQDETLEKFDISYFIKNKIAIGAYFGTTSAIFLRSQIRDLAKDHFTNIEDALTMIGKKKLRFFYYHDLGLNHYVKNSEYPLKIMAPKFRTSPQWVIFSKKTPPSVIKEIDEVLLQMDKEGELQKIREGFY